MQTSSYIRAGGALLAAALRDPADIITGSTLWEFIQLTETFCEQLSEPERESYLYQQLLVYQGQIDGLMFTDVTPVGDAFRFGSTLLEAFAVYVEQASLVMAFFLGSQSLAQRTAFVQPFDRVLSMVVREIEEVPGEASVQLALAAFKQCQADMTSEGNLQ